ncbi:hypothetical protein B0I35DRAFT_376348, partial [Stachybotrys elegans]
MQHEEAEAIEPIERRHDGEFPWHLGVFDVHNHVAERMQSLQDFPQMKSRAICIMATRSQDQSLVSSIVAEYGLGQLSQLQSAHDPTVVAGYGWHPWFSHELYDDTLSDPTFNHSGSIDVAKTRHYQAVLVPPPEEALCVDFPTPLPLSEFITATKARLSGDPIAIVGEIGLDRRFRVPMPWTADAQAVRDPARTPGGRERRPLSKHNITMAHQKAVLLAQLTLAGEMGRPVSVHGVQVNGILYDVLAGYWKGHELKGKRAQQKEARENGKTLGADTPGTVAKPFPPRICLHSFSGNADAVKQYLKPSIPAKIFFSFSRRHNFSSPEFTEKSTDALRLVPDDRLLVESDLHVAGQIMDAELEAVYRKICDIKGWSLEYGVAKIADNFVHFIFGEGTAART